MYEAINVSAGAIFANDIRATGKYYRDAFAFLEEGGLKRGLPRPLYDDLKTLNDA